MRVAAQPAKAEAGKAMQASPGREHQPRLRPIPYCGLLQTVTSRFRTLAVENKYCVASQACTPIGGIPSLSSCSDSITSAVLEPNADLICIDIGALSEWVPGAAFITLGEVVVELITTGFNSHLHRQTGIGLVRAF